MRIKIQYTLEVDEEDWANEYELHDPTGKYKGKEWKALIREDIKSYFESPGSVIPEHLEGVVEMK
jgi:hypothetical protein|tara:strand:- start:75 stop:269 length:195 start_codon:yes stop_codon:yes gene_type:complete